MADKYKKLKRQVSNDGGQTWQDMIPYEYIAGELIERDSPDCNNVEWRTVSGYICEENTTEMTQWVADTGYVCVGFDKYNKEKEQVSYNSGISWADTGNTRAGSTLIEQNSDDCGYTPPHDYSRDYLTTEALNSGNMKITQSYGSNIQYSKNDGAWTSYTPGSNISVVTGDTIRWKSSVTNSQALARQFACTCNYKAYGNILSLLKGDEFIGVTDISGYMNSPFRGLFMGQTTLKDVSNLIMSVTTLADDCCYSMFQGCTSLTTAPALPATTLASFCYRSMFQGCTSLTTAPALPATTLADDCYDMMFYNCSSLTTAPNTLPATTLADMCYNQMFQGCTSLTTAPSLPATTLAYYCYQDMFAYCTSLSSVPSLPATTLEDGCYNSMFMGCTSLTTVPSNLLPATTLEPYCYMQLFNGCASLTNAPDLPAATLTNGCYNRMLTNCERLNSIKCLATNKSANGCTEMWTYNVASTGTFTKAAGVTWSTGDDGIPSGWTIVDAT